jgi:malate dehydrogenase (quinone)
MLQVIERSFDKELKEGGRTRLKEMIPSYGESLIDDPALCDRVRAQTAAVLGLEDLSTSQPERTLGAVAAHSPAPGGS